MTRSQGNVTCVRDGLFWTNAGSDNGIRQLKSLCVEGEERDVNECVKPFLGSTAVTPCRLVVDQLRDKQFIFLAALSPPLLGHLLFTRDDNIFRSPRLKETRNRRLDVDRRLQVVISIFSLLLATSHSLLATGFMRRYQPPVTSYSLLVCRHR